jgi:energy-converting hydrogenase Eha subunit E
MELLLLGLILLVLGSVIAWYGRPREDLIVVAGVIIFAVGVAFVVWWAFNQAEDAEAFVRSSWGLT